MKNIKVVIAVVVLLIVGFFGAKSFYNESEKTRLSDLAKKDGAPFVRDYAYSFGKGDIVLVEFMDPMCGACAAFHPLAKRVFNEYEQELKVVIRYLSSHPTSQYMVRLLEASRKQDKYQEVLDVVFKNQPLWGNVQSPKPKSIWQYLNAIEGLDLAKLRLDFEQTDITSQLVDDRVDATALGVRGTPSFFVNGKKVDTLSFEALLDAVELEIYK